MTRSSTKPQLVIHPPFIYTKNMLAEALKVNYKTITNMITKGELVPIFRDYSGYRFSYFTMPKWLREALPVPGAKFISGDWSLKVKTPRRNAKA